MSNRDYVLRVLEQTEEKEERFFAAWKRGVELIGEQLFGPKKPATAHDKNDLRPRLHLAEAAIAEQSCGEEQFYTAMVSFYNPAVGEELVEKIDCHKSFCGLTYNLDHEHIDILCELLRNYQGWPEAEETFS